MTIYEMQGSLLRETFGSDLSDLDAFLVFVLFHSYRVILKEGVLSDRPGVQEVSAGTQRSVSESLASLWRGRDDVRADYAYWYRRWNGKWGSYSHAENLTTEEQKRLEYLREQLERHPAVVRMEPED